MVKKMQRKRETTKYRREMAKGKWEIVKWTKGKREQVKWKRENKGKWQKGQKEK